MRLPSRRRGDFCWIPCFVRTARLESVLPSVVGSAGKGEPNSVLQGEGHGAWSSRIRPEKLHSVQGAWKASELSNSLLLCHFRLWFSI